MKHVLIYCILFAAVLSLLPVGSLRASTDQLSGYQEWANPKLESLDLLSIERLRKRFYSSEFQLVKEVKYSSRKEYRTYISSYQSDGLRIYARIDTPKDAAPEGGFPVLVLIHGYVGIKNAPGFDFYINQDSNKSRYIEQFVQQGFMVITLGLRGHGTFQDKPADGIEFMSAWDNSTYISPVFYAIDVLNALNGLVSIKPEFARHKIELNLDMKRIYLSGHSQGGDVAMISLAITGEGSDHITPIAAASVWAGCFLPRFEQAKLYGSMQMTPQAFMSGDGTWTSKASSSSGEINYDFQFGFPPDWIGSTRVQDWTWQHDSWRMATVKEVYQYKFDEMYRNLNHNIAELDSLTYTIDSAADTKTTIQHDPDLVLAYSKIDPFSHPDFLLEPLNLHFSDQDFYSPPEWNFRLADLIKKQGGDVATYLYPYNTHGFAVSKQIWFSPKGAEGGLVTLIKRDLELFGKH